MHGTWKTTGGGGDLSGLLVAAVLVVIAAAAVMAVMEFIVLIAGILGVLLVLAAAGLAWYLHGQPARKARYAVAYQAAFAAREEAERRQALERRQFALELARASAPVIQNVIDPAFLLAAGLQPQPARVVRGEVER